MNPFCGLSKHTDAAVPPDPKSLQCKLREVKSISGTGIIELPASMTFRSLLDGAAETEPELRKEGCWGLPSHEEPTNPAPAGT